MTDFFRVCIHLKGNHISFSNWIQIFSIHELSSLWFLNRSIIYHLSYAFTPFITIAFFSYYYLLSIHVNIYFPPPYVHSFVCVCDFPWNLPLSHCNSPLSQFSFFLSDRSNMAGLADNHKPFHCSDLFLKENKQALIQKYKHI